jgi:hypothetical protein
VSQPGSQDKNGTDRTRLGGSSRPRDLSLARGYASPHLQAPVLRRYLPLPALPLCPPLQSPANPASQAQGPKNRNPGPEEDGCLVLLPLRRPGSPALPGPRRQERRALPQRRPAWRRWCRIHLQGNQSTQCAYRHPSATGCVVY